MCNHTWVPPGSLLSSRIMGTFYSVGFPLPASTLAQKPSANRKRKWRKKGRKRKVSSQLQDQGWHPSSKPLREGRAASTDSFAAPTGQSPLYFQFRPLTDMGLLSPINAHQVPGKWALSEWMPLCPSVFKEPEGAGAERVSSPGLSGRATT